MANKNSSSSSKRSVARGAKPAAGSTYVVYGREIHAGGNFTSGLQVKAFDQDIAREDILGGAVTDQDGHYQITYSERQFRLTQNTDNQRMIT